MSCQVRAELRGARTGSQGQAAPGKALALPGQWGCTGGTGAGTGLGWGHRAKLGAPGLAGPLPPSPGHRAHPAAEPRPHRRAPRSPSPGRGQARPDSGFPKGIDTLLLLFNTTPYKTEAAAAILIEGPKLK